MEKDIYSKFKNINSQLKLSKEERDFHREKILSFIDGPRLISNKPRIPSPFIFGFFSSRLVFTAVVAFLVLGTGTGLVVGAEKSLPNSSLYQLKVNVLEPTQLFLTFDPEEKVDLKVAFIDEALKDFSKVTLKQSLDQEETDQFAESVSERVKSVHQDILGFSENDKLADALEVANDLKSVLSTQNVVLSKVNLGNTDTTNIDDISDNINQNLDATINIIDNIKKEVGNPENKQILDSTIEDQKVEINSSLSDVGSVVEYATKEQQNFDSEDKSYVDSELHSISDIIKQGDDKFIEGKKEEAFLFYNTADQKIGDLKSLIETDEDLGIDLLGDKNN